MMRVDFYHLQKSPLEAALPQLLEKVLGAGKQAVVKASSSDRVDSLNASLWQAADAWLPHGSAKDGFAEDQPIWLTTEDEAPNGAEILVLTDGTDGAAIGDFERCLDLFDGNDPAALDGARKRWVACKEAGYELHYWQQTDRGGWQEKVLG